MKNFSLKFESPDGTISVEDFMDLKEFFDKNLLIGAELERVVPRENAEVADALRTAVLRYGDSHNAERTYLLYKKARTKNKNNVAFVTSDATVRYNNEILYAGNNEGFLWNQKKLSMVEECLTGMNAPKYDTSASSHITVLTSYNKKIHGNILKNVFNVVRGFSSALYWLGGGNGNQIVRNINRFAPPISQYTPNSRSLFSLQGVCTKYRFLNLSKQSFISPREMDGLMFEFRNVDGLRVPSAMAGNMSLYRALIYKSAELSMDGIVQISGLCTNWKQNKSITYKLTMGQRLTTQEQEFCKQEAHNLIDFLYSYLKKDYSQLPDVLHRIADKPVHVCYTNGLYNNQIEKEYMVESNDLKENEKTLLYEIIKGKVKAESIGAWKKKFANEKSCSVRWVEKKLKKFSDLKKMDFVFDSEQKTMRLC